MIYDKAVSVIPEGERLVRFTGGGSVTDDYVIIEITDIVLDQNFTFMVNFRNSNLLSALIFESDSQRGLGLSNTIDSHIFTKYFVKKMLRNLKLEGREVIIKFEHRPSKYFSKILDKEVETVKAIPIMVKAKEN